MKTPIASLATSQAHRAPLEHRKNDFLRTLERQGYAPLSVAGYKHALRRMIQRIESIGGNEISQKGSNTDNSLRKAMESHARRASRVDRYCVTRFLDYLIEIGDLPASAPLPVITSPRASLKREYDAYLREQRGLSDATIYHCLRFYDRFLVFRFGDGAIALDTIRPNDIIAFFLNLRKGKISYRDKTVPSHLRTLFTFLFWSGRTTRDLSLAVPRARQAQPTHIPRYLSPEDVQRLIDAARDNDYSGRRDHAMLLLLARLGLRAPEVTAIQLADIDWRNGEIAIRGKGKRHDRMPLTSEVGGAIVDYIRNERKGGSRLLFVGSRAPFRGFGDAQILNRILDAAYKRTGLSAPQKYIGSHVLRHSLATDMLRKGASLDEIGDVLRHRSRMSTSIYAKHNIDALRSIARPWPIAGGVK